MPLNLTKFSGLIYLPLLLFYLYVVRYTRYIYANNHIDSLIFYILKRFHQFYLTVWNFDGQIIFILVAFLSELSAILGVNERVQEFVGAVRTCMFTAITFPCSLLVHLTFWAFYMVDRELIMPACMDSFYPLWLNHCVHSVILVPLLIEMFLPTKFQRASAKTAVLILLTVSVVYQCALFGVYFFHGFFLYPFFLDMTWTGRLLFCQLEVVLALVFLFLGIQLQKKFKRIIPKPNIE